MVIVAVLRAGNRHDHVTDVGAAPAYGARLHVCAVTHVPVVGSHHLPDAWSRTAISTLATIVLSVAVPEITTGASMMAPFAGDVTVSDGREYS